MYSLKLESNNRSRHLRKVLAKGNRNSLAERIRDISLSGA